MQKPTTGDFWDETLFDLSQAEEDIQDFLLRREGLGLVPFVITKAYTQEHVVKLRGALHKLMLHQDRASHPLRIRDCGGLGLRFELTINPPNI